MISLATVDDEADGPEKTVEVTLTAPDPALATLGTPSTASGTIRDDEGLSEVTVAAAAATVAEGADAVFTLTRANGDASGALAVSVTVTDADAALVDAAADLPTAVTFEAGAATATLRLATVDDAVDEPDAAVTLTLQAVQAGAGYRLGAPHQATVTVQDDDLPVVTVAAAAEAVTEGADAVFTLTRAGILSATLEVAVEVADADAVLADALPASVTFAADAATATLALATDDDEADEPDAEVTLTLQAVQAGAAYRLGAPHQATVTVRDDDRPVVTIADAGPVTEGEAIEFPVRLSGPFDEAIEVAYQLGGTATAGDDYTPAASGTVTFVPPQTERMVRIETVDDDVDEAEETVEIEIFVFYPGRPGEPDTARATILDDDLPVVTVAADAATVTEGADAAFTLTRTGLLADALTVTFAVTGGDAVLDGAPPTEATFEADAATARVTLATDDDRTDEADARVVLTLASGDAWAVGAASEAAVTVEDDDGTPEVSIADAAPVTEGAALEFPVTLSHPSAAAITVAYTLAGSATAEDDYADGGAGAVTFAPGDVRTVVSVATVDDEADEAEETVEITSLANPASATDTFGIASRSPMRMR